LNESETNLAPQTTAEADEQVSGKQGLIHDSQRTRLQFFCLHTRQITLKTLPLQVLQRVLPILFPQLTDAAPVSA